MDKRKRSTMQLGQDDRCDEIATHDEKYIDAEISSGKKARVMQNDCYDCERTQAINFRTKRNGFMSRVVSHDFLL